MLNNFDYLWKRLLCVCVCVNSTFGRCCDCPCWKKETLYFTIDKTNQDEKNIKKCFNETWYNECQNKVLSLQQVNENGSDVLKVTGSDNKWEITDQGNVLESAGCKPNNNKWIIVKVTTRKVNTECAGDSFIFYVDDINSVVNGARVFEEIQCYSIEIIAANTRAVQNMVVMFFNVTSALERDGKEDTAPGLIGLDKLNVENVEDIGAMFYNAIHKQATLDQLGKWRFSGENKVNITNVFYSLAKGLDFTVLNGWSSAKKCGTVSFMRTNSGTNEQVFVSSDDKNDFYPPRWYKNIVEAK